MALGVDRVALGGERERLVRVRPPGELGHVGGVVDTGDERRDLVGPLARRRDAATVLVAHREVVATGPTPTWCSKIATPSTDAGSGYASTTPGGNVFEPSPGVRPITRPGSHASSQPPGSAVQLRGSSRARTSVPRREVIRSSRTARSRNAHWRPISAQSSIG